MSGRGFPSYVPRAAAEKPPPAPGTGKGGFRGQASRHADSISPLQAAPETPASPHRCNRPAPSGRCWSTCSGAGIGFACQRPSTADTWLAYFCSSPLLTSTRSIRNSKSCADMPPRCTLSAMAETTACSFPTIARGQTLCGLKERPAPSPDAGGNAAGRPSPGLQRCPLFGAHPIRLDEWHCDRAFQQGRGRRRMFLRGTGTSCPCHQSGHIIVGKAPQTTTPR